MITISVVLILIYSLLILDFVYGFDQIKLFETSSINQITHFSIVIPFRNEAKNLPILLESLTQLKYSKNKFEVLLINDNSNDGFENIIDNFKLKHRNIDLKIIDNIRKTNSPKKDAIDIGINASKYQWIITTDADCSLPKKLLNSLDDFIQKESPKMIVSPVTFYTGNTFLEKFQNLDFLSLQGSTIGGFGIKKPFLCNGANLCYNKTAFLEVNGFTGNHNVASGDDIFLLEKMIKLFPEKVKYLKSNEVIVTTKPEVTLKQLMQQRIRWASKTKAYNQVFGKVVGIIVFTTNAFLILLFALAVINRTSWQHFGLFFLIKFNVDFLLLYKASLFFNQQQTTFHKLL